MILTISVKKILLSSLHWNFQANVNKISINPAKNTWNFTFFLTFWHGHRLIMKVVSLAQFLKKEFFNLHFFSFEITHRSPLPVRQTSADLAANFKLTNQRTQRGGGIMLLVESRKLLPSSSVNGHKHVRFGQIVKIFESSRRFQLHNFTQKYFQKTLKTLKN